MSFPGGGVFAVTIGSKAASKKSGWRRASIASTVSPPATGSRAPFFEAIRAASASSAGVTFNTNLRASRFVGPGVDRKAV
jgi:hypothetical protein